MGPTFGNMEGCSFLRVFEKKKKKFLFRGIFMKVSRDMLKCPVNRYLFPQGPCWGKWKGFIYQEFFREIRGVSGFLYWTQRTLRL